MRLHSLDEVQERNAAGEMLILIDGMVLDVTRWLPEHPGGATIIPKQSLNVDATRFFEVPSSSSKPLLSHCLLAIVSRTK